MVGGRRRPDRPCGRRRYADRPLTRRLAQLIRARPSPRVGRRKRPPPRTRNGTPTRASASSNIADCTFTPVEDGQFRDHGCGGSLPGASNSTMEWGLGGVGLVLGDRGGRGGPSALRSAPRGPASAFGEHCGGRHHDLRRGAVVAAELDWADTGKVVCANSASDGRVPRRRTRRSPVGVADDGQLAGVRRASAEQLQLRGADVLELVDEQVAESPALRGGESASFSIASATTERSSKSTRRRRRFSFS